MSKPQKRIGRMIVWKHHVSSHFKENNTITGGAIGGTVFLDFDRMLEYLALDGRAWHVSPLSVHPTDIDIDPCCAYMATLTRYVASITPFKPVSEYTRGKPKTL